LYEQAKRYDEALSLTRQALFFAQTKQSHRLLYLWQWQLGRIKKTLGDNKGAIRNYQQAIKHLARIRLQAMTGYFNFMTDFRQQISPVYVDLADLLLQQASSIQVASSRDKLLRQAIDAMEEFKEAELQNYFQSRCIDLKTECADLKRILDQKTAILYPIMLPTRLELLLYRRDGLVQATLPIEEKHSTKKLGLFYRACVTTLIQGKGLEIEVCLLLLVRNRLWRFAHLHNAAVLRKKQVVHPGF